MPDPKTVTDGITLTQILAAIAATALVGGGVWKALQHAVPFARKLLRLVDGLQALLGNDELGQPSLATQVTDIHKQVFNNGGSSLKDSVDRQETAITQLAGRVDEIADAQIAQAASAEQKAAAIEDLAVQLRDVSSSLADHIAEYKQGKSD